MSDARAAEAAAERQKEGVSGRFDGSLSKPWVPAGDADTSKLMKILWRPQRDLNSRWRRERALSAAVPLSEATGWSCVLRSL